MDDEVAPDEPAFRVSSDSPEFWRNLRALAPYARSDHIVRFPEWRQQQLAGFAWRYWIDAVLGQLPWQIRERTQEALVIPAPRGAHKIESILSRRGKGRR